MGSTVYLMRLRKNLHILVVTVHKKIKILNFNNFSEHIDLRK